MTPVFSAARNNLPHSYILPVTRWGRVRDDFMGNRMALPLSSYAARHAAVTARRGKTVIPGGENSWLYRKNKDRTLLCPSTGDAAIVPAVFFPNKI